MALLWIEGFEGFGSTLDSAPSPSGIVGRKYGSVASESTMKIQTGRTGGKSLELATSNCYFQKSITMANDTIIIGFAFLADALLTSGYLVNCYDGIGMGMRLYVDTAGTFGIIRNTTRLETTTNSITASVWYYIEYKIKVHASAGSYELRVNDTVWASDSGINTQTYINPFYDAIRFIGPYSFVTSRIDDLYICDDSGTYNNDFLGNVKVVAINPDSAGDDTDWTPASGANYAAVDDGQELDEDSTYVETSGSLDQDLYNYESLSSVGSIKGIQINTEVRVTDAESYDLNNVIKSGTTTDEGTEETISSTSYATSSRVQETDPDTSASWTASNINSCQFGIKATTV